MRVKTIANLGAYLSTFASSVPTILYATLLAGQYRTPAIFCEVTGVFTNTAPVDAYRGAGRPEATYVVERLVEQCARDLKVDPAELRRQNDITNMNANAKLTQAGAFGGGRQAIMNAENNRNLMMEQNKTVGQGYANAYDKAMGQFNTEQQQGRDLTKMMSDIGGIQRGITSEGLAADKKAFEDERDFAYNMPKYQLSLLSGLPIGANTTAMNQDAISKMSSDIAGLGSLYQNLSKLIPK
jgi:hypothetical protein